MDKVYIDGPFELLISRSMDKLLAEHFCNQETYTAYAMLLLVLFIKVSHVIRSFETRKQNTGCRFKATWSICVYFIYGLKPHGPSM